VQRVGRTKGVQDSPRVSAFPRLAGAVAMIVLTPAACADTTEPPPELSAESSFETGMDGWTPEGTDLTDPVVPWSIQRSPDRAVDGEWSLRLRLENYNDQGKIWVRRSFAASPGRSYRAVITYRFASADYGSANLWSIIAGALPSEPVGAADLPIRESTGNGSDSDIGWMWLDKRYEQPVRAGADGRVHVLIGVWGTWEAPRTYYIDEVHVKLEPVD